MINAVIVDDEALARDVIKAYLKDHEDISIVAECSNGFEGVKAIGEHTPDLIFLDIQMPKLTGFEMLELLDKPPVIIFSTAYDEYAIKAFEKSAADYLLKPYAKNRFNEAIIKAREKLSNADSGKQIAEKIEETRREVQERLDRIVVKSGSKIVIIDTANIDLITAQDDYVEILAEGKKYLKQLTMKYLEASLPSDRFIRVHRSSIVAVESIDRLEALSKDSYLAILKTGDTVAVSRTGYNALRELLNF